MMCCRDYWCRVKIFFFWGTRVKIFIGELTPLYTESCPKIVECFSESIKFLLLMAFFHGLHFNYLSIFLAMIHIISDFMIVQLYSLVNALSAVGLHRNCTRHDPHLIIFFTLIGLLKCSRYHAILKRCNWHKLYLAGVQYSLRFIIKNLSSNATRAYFHSGNMRYQLW
jgi:hypothetical protein